MKKAHAMNIRSENCKLYRLLDIIGKKRVTFIIYLMIQGYDSFNQINNTIPMMSGKILSERLKVMRELGIITKNIESATPVKIRYHLTPLGKKVAEHILALGKIVDSNGPF